MPHPTRPPRTAALLAVLLALLPSSAAAQEGCPGIAVPWSLEGPRLFPGRNDAGHLRAGSDFLGWGCSDGVVRPAPRLSWTPVALRGSFRSAYPIERNNGALWEGRGASLALSGGGRFVTPRLEITLAPVAAYQQNRDFRIAPRTQNIDPMRYPYHQMDWPQRFGERAFWTVDPGQSAIGVRQGPLGARFGTENVWWGPARRYPLLFGNSAPGFPHLRIGIDRPVSIGVGDLQAHVLWGRLDESDYFDGDAGNDLRLLSAVFVQLQPSFLPGLTVGFTGLQHNEWRRRAELYLNLFTFPFKEKATTAGNGLLSAIVSWSLPESGFEAYSEWAREDYWDGTEDLLTEPDHSQAYTIGFEKVYRDRARPIRIAYELSHLGASATTQSKRSNSTVTFYEHSGAIQGHTNRGQLLGAWIGPGSDAQYLALDLELDRRRTVGAYLERIRHDDDTYYIWFARTYGFRGHDVEWTFALQGLERVGPFELQWDGGLSRRKNRQFLGLDGVNWNLLRETNLALTLTGWWLPGR